MKYNLKIASITLLFFFLFILGCISSKRTKSSNYTIENLGSTTEPVENMGYYLQFYGAGLHDVSRYPLCSYHEAGQNENNYINIGTEIFKKIDKDHLENNEKYADVDKISSYTSQCFTKSFLQGIRFFVGENMSVLCVPTFVSKNELSQICQNKSLKVAWNNIQTNNNLRSTSDFEKRVNNWLILLHDRSLLHVNDLHDDIFTNGDATNFLFCWQERGSIEEPVKIYFEKAGTDINGNNLYKIFCNVSNYSYSHSGQKTQVQEKRYLAIHFQNDKKSTTVEGVNSNDLENAAAFTNSYFDRSHSKPQIWKLISVKTKFGNLNAFQEQTSKRYLRISGCSTFTVLQ